MTSTDQTTATEADAPARVEHDTDTFGVGEPCGVCIFPTGAGQICGNVVYANQAKGRLPKYCGQEGQEQWQAQHGTEGNARHRSELAAYPRRQLGLTPEDVQALAEAETARRGITRRLKGEAPAEIPAAPVAAVPPADLAAALPESPVEALHELARLLVGRVSAVRSEMDQVRADADQRKGELAAEHATVLAELETQRAGLESDRAEQQAATERAETEIREAHESQLRTEGELAAAQRRVAELEQALAAAETRHRAELEQVRTQERENFQMLVNAFRATRTENIDAEAIAASIAPAPAAAPVAIPAAAPKPIGTDAVRMMAQRIAHGEITRSREGVWLQPGGPANRSAARNLDKMSKDGLLVVGDFDGEGLAPVTLTETGAQHVPAGAPSEAAQVAPWEQGGGL